MSRAEGTDGTTAKAAKCAKAENRSGEESYHEDTKKVAGTEGINTKARRGSNHGWTRIDTDESRESGFAIRNSAFDIPW